MHSATRCSRTVPASQTRARRGRCGHLAATRISPGRTTPDTETAHPCQGVALCNCYALCELAVDSHHCGHARLLSRARVADSSDPRTIASLDGRLDLDHRNRLGGLAYHFPSAAAAYEPGTRQGHGDRHVTPEVTDKSLHVLSPVVRPVESSTGRNSCATSSRTSA